MNELALFAGAGGGLLASRLLGWTTIAAVEKNRFCRRVVFSRQREGLLDKFPIWGDVRTFDGKIWRGLVDVISGGVPCQPFSVAGKKKDKEDDRNMWPDTIRIIREVGPAFAFLENVPGLLASDYFGEIIGKLAEIGYDVEWCVVSVAAFGAPHLRKRLWLLAYSRRLRWYSGRPGESLQGFGAYDQVPNPKSIRLRGSEPQCHVKKIEGRRRRNVGEPGEVGISETPTDAEFLRRQIHVYEIGNGFPKTGKPSGNVVNDGVRRGTRKYRPNANWWFVEPGMGRVVDGVVDRVERITALGNGQVPVVAAWAFLALAERAALRATKGLSIGTV